MLQREAQTAENSMRWEQSLKGCFKLEMKKKKKSETQKKKNIVIVIKQQRSNMQIIDITKQQIRKIKSC